MKWYVWLIPLVAAVVALAWFGFSGFMNSVMPKNYTKYPGMTSEQLIALPDDVLVLAVSLRLDKKYDFPPIDHRDIEKMNDVDQTVYCVGAFDLEVNNGGLYQYFYNSSRYTAPFLPQCLRSVSAADMEYAYSDFLRQNDIDVYALNIHDGPYVADEHVLSLFDDMFSQIYEDENLQSLLAAYIRSHIDVF